MNSDLLCWAGGRKERLMGGFFLSADTYQSVKYAVRHLSHSWYMFSQTEWQLNLARPPCCPLKSCYCSIRRMLGSLKGRALPPPLFPGWGSPPCLYPHPPPFLPCECGVIWQCTVKRQEAFRLKAEVSLSSGQALSWQQIWGWDLLSWFLNPSLKQSQTWTHREAVTLNYLYIIHAS